jgi:capsular polysaccharide export protein
MAQPSNPPLLRSPPFPSVAPAVAAVSAWREPPNGLIRDLDRAAALVARIETENVGGEFWNPVAPPLDLQGLRDDPAHAHDTLIARVAYRDPFSGAETTAEETVTLLSHWQREIRRNPGWGGKKVSAVGIAKWKQREVTQLMWSGAGSQMHFVTAREAMRGEVIISWPSRTDPDLPDRATAAGIPYWQMEDGFIRSVGLGAACHPPFSIVADAANAHYDPSGPSDLETLLATCRFTEAQLTRADELITLIVRSGISKYEVGTAAPPEAPRSRRRVLVTGQVEDDLSVLLGGGAIRSNIELLRRARALEPDAEIWFKPHPDVDAGHRKGHVGDADALVHVDRVIRGVPMAALFDMIDGMHVLTSLAGFEALLRGVEVTTHGTPFYAGWGLTRDEGVIPARRNRSLRLNELVAGVLLDYPRYLDLVTCLPCTAEILIRRLSEQKRPQETWLTRLRNLQGWVYRRISHS